jgi:hypothetical protein
MINFARYLQKILHSPSYRICRNFLFHFRFKLVPVILFVFMIFFSNCKKDNVIGDTQSFVKFYGTNLSNTGYDVKQTSDGGYVILGTVENSNRGTDIYLVKTDQYGNQLWGPKYYGGTLDDNGYSVQLTADGGYILAGSIDTVLNSKTISKIFIVKTNGSGDTTWTKTIGGTENDEAYFVQLNGSIGYLVAGYTESYGAGGKDAILISLDLDGKVNWSRTYGGASDDDAKCVQLTTDGFIFIGSTKYSQVSTNNVFIVKTNKLGLIESTAIIGDDDNISGEYLQALPDSGFICTGTRLQSGSTYSSIYLFKLASSSYNVSWSKNIGGTTGNDEGKSVILTSDSCFAVIGTHVVSDNLSNFYFIKTDGQGNELFSKFYGQSGLQHAENFEQTTDNGFVMIGTNNMDGNSMITLIKVKPDGGL